RLQPDSHGLFQHLTAVYIMIPYSIEKRKKIIKLHDFSFLVFWVMEIFDAEGVLLCLLSCSNASSASLLAFSAA
ncbi:MAG: hypothetical protein SOV46_00550, partial [Candidatus Faecousia sp.]|nr:hypothetical protein [Candidatus Faecousia sp.]